MLCQCAKLKTIGQAVLCAAVLALPTLTTNAQTQAQTHMGTANPASQSKSGLDNRPDYPLKNVPQGPISPKFLINHRTALKGKVVRVRGIVVAAPGPANVPPADGATLIANANPQPRIFLADTTGEKRDRSYDLTVMLREGDDKFAIGARVVVTGVVEAGHNVVYLRRTY